MNVTLWHTEKHKQPTQYLAKCDFKRLVKAVVAGRLDNVPTMLAPFCTGKLESELCITVLVPKEKKLKRKGRYFSVQSLYCQVYQVVTEINTKEHVMPLIQTYSMTMTSTWLNHALAK